MSAFHGPCNTFSQIYTLGKSLFKGKTGSYMPRGTGSQDKGVKGVLLYIPDDLLPGFLAAQERKISTMPDRRGLIGNGPESGNVNGTPNLASAADIYTYVL
jgi:hypothetical protein